MFTFVAGAIVGSEVPKFVAEELAQGPNVQCIDVSGHAICKGQAIAKLPSEWDRKLGGIVGIDCDFHRPGMAKLNGSSHDVASITSGCKTTRYVVTLSDGAVLTNFWINDGKIAQIDRFDANPIDF